MGLFFGRDSEVFCYGSFDSNAVSVGGGGRVICFALTATNPLSSLGRDIAGGGEGSLGVGQKWAWVSMKSGEMGRGFLPKCEWGLRGFASKGQEAEVCGMGCSFSFVVDLGHLPLFLFFFFY